VLVEAAVIGKSGEEARLKTEAYQKQPADALLRSVLFYFARNPPLRANALCDIPDQANRSLRYSFWRWLKRLLA
jgi:hypothetical protein